MNYILDISCLDTYSSGAKQRFLSLYSELIKDNKKKKFIIFYTSFDKIKSILKYPNVNFIKNPINQDNYFKKLLSVLYVFIYIRFKYKNVKSIENFTLPFFNVKNFKSIFTIHDLRKIHFSNFIFTKLAFKIFFKHFLSKSKNIIVVSKSVKNEMFKYFKELNISVIYNTIETDSFKKIRNKEIYQIKKKYKLPDNFILTVGHHEMRKNFLRLIKAIHILKKEHPSIKLILVGQKADETLKIKNLINNLKLSSNIKIFSNLNDFELRCFYRLSKLFVFPSIYEGFGIPILESMASSKPMVLSNLEVFREITENKYVYFDEYDPLSIANKIKYVMKNKKIQKKMVNYGRKRIKYFSIDNQKKNINHFYKRIN